ncbi:polysaccharide biosynthesis protein [Synechococcales cyanobacterium C]|uniref:Polysaccharide biosynthesis protein n=1 Tax=Petrachloros mirabilis ULC683 TaxID=2781853 RepID=A0A8K1ZXL6_9CYAN|nr:nucleoside-diphosphate sugar epimerase/dehydratase [Petrachloros mirabilis]NCJ07064.1 polysaccharide biosynthesis protein [Petrachloros mirabilis ULC683]
MQKIQLPHVLHLIYPTWRRPAQQALDCISLGVAFWLALALRLQNLWPRVLIESASLLPWMLLAVICLFPSLGLYRSLTRCSGSYTYYRLVASQTLLTGLMYLVWELKGESGFPRTSWLIFWNLSLMLLVGWRVLLRDGLLFWNQRSHPTRRQPVLIYGAGAAGQELLRALRQSPEFKIVGMIDDDPKLLHQELNGMRIYSPYQLPQLRHRFGCETVLLAIPSLSPMRRRRLIQNLEQDRFKVLTIPAMTDLLSGKAQVDQLRPIQIEDLLGRHPVQPLEKLLRACVYQKSVMVTGAGGSIGSELARQILALHPQRLVLFEMSEFGLYQIHQELTQRFPQAELVPILGTVCDRTLLERVMRRFQIQTVYHAAAYKHVPMVELNPIQGLLNNTFGTLHSAKAAIAAEVETFVLISTDKAVRPTNIMGASKRLAELVLQALAQEPHATRFTMVRFGNVLGSSGSVVPRFMAQIRSGGPVEVTHPEITRFFMTIPEAVQLLLQASAMGKGGDVFLLHMGDSVKIVDLARQMIQLAGYTVREPGHPQGDIEIVFTGLRPGEKLYEELLIQAEHLSTEHPLIFRAEEEGLSWHRLRATLEQLEAAMAIQDYEFIVALLHRLVAGYPANAPIHALLNSPQRQQVLV